MPDSLPTEAPPPSARSALVQYFKDVGRTLLNDPLTRNGPAFPWKSVLPSSVANYAPAPPMEGTGYTRAPRAFDGYPYVMKFLRAYNGGPPVTSDDLVNGVMGNLDPRMQAARGVGDILNMIRGTAYPPAGECQDIGNIIERRNRNTYLPAQPDNDLHA